MEKSPTRNWDWLIAILLFLLIQVTGARLVTTEWTPGLSMAEPLAGLGIALGLALGLSRFGRAAVSWLAIGYTAIVLPWQMSTAVQDKFFLDRLRHIGNILLVSWGQFSHRLPVKDPLFFVAFVCIVFWILSVVAGYYAARHRNVLAGIIPSAIIILLVQIYANYQLRSSWWLALYVVLALLMIGRVYFLKNEKIWADQRVFVNDEAWANILGGLFVTVSAAVLIAWMLPASISSVQGVRDSWTNMTQRTRDRLSDAVTSLKGPNSKPGINFYGSALGLGQNAASGDAPVFNVHVLETPASYLRYYWRGRVYDSYNNGQWSASTSSTFHFVPTSPDLKVPYANNRSNALLRFTLQFPTQSLIYAPSEPVWVDQSANVQTTPVDNGLNDVLLWQTNRSIDGGKQYQVRSEISNPDLQALRAASTSYPQWIQDRYLEVPAGLQVKFRALAEKAAAGKGSPYDKAAAITSYLRANITYSTNVPAAPEGRDPVDWVLFSYKKGFCNYYASAEVLMLRSIGIPARLAVGFAQGEYVNGTYVVRTRDAHAWPEVFFPGIGWVEFEPTASQQALVRTDLSALGNGAIPNRPIRPLQDEGAPRPIKRDPNEVASTVPFARTSTGRAVIFAASLLALGLLGFLFYRYHAFTFAPLVLARAFERTGVSTPKWIANWTLWNRLHPVEQAFASINVSLRWLGKPAPMHATPAERAATLRGLMPDGLAHIDIVASELERGLFTPEPADVPRARKAGLMVLLHAVRAGFVRRLQALDGRDVYSS